MKFKVVKIVAVVVILLVLIFIFGPRPTFKPIDLQTNSLSFELGELDSFLLNEEKKVKDIKRGNEAKIVWYNNEIKKTEYAILYLHGFSASHMEGYPIHTDFAKKYGCNLFLSRLEAHGIEDENAFKALTPDDYFESAQKAMEIAKKLGDKVIVMSCSTGSTLSILLAKTNPEIHSFIMFSPNIDIKDPMSFLTVGPWGKELTELVLDGEYNYVSYPEEAKKYWYTKYHINGIIALKKFIVDQMTEANFKNISQPLFMSYYYKNEKEQDDVVSVARMLEFYDQVATPENKKRKINQKDANTHITSSSIFNKHTKELTEEVDKFAEEILLLRPVSQ